MMMSPLNILSTSAPEVTSASSVSRSPESVCSTKSISPPGLAPSLMPKDSQAAAAAAAASAASLIQAFASANPHLANPSALAQMFPGFPLHMAAAFAGYANQGNQQAAAAAAAAQHAQNPYGALYAQVQQQQLSSLLNQAARQHQFMTMQSGKKLADFEPTFSAPPPTSKLSPNSMHPPPPPTHHLGHSPTSNSLYPRNGAPQHANPLMPLTMMAKGQSSPNPPNPAISSSNNSSSNSSGSSNLLSPILFSPLSASSASDAAYKRKLGLPTGPNEAAEVPTANPGSVNSDSAFSMANFQRMTAARNSPGTNPSGTSAGSAGSFICPICNESLDGVDLNAHFYEELHKIDSLRKMAVWSVDETESKSKEISPYEKFGTSFAASGANGSTSYQKKLQLPQSRWETFQRIRQNRHQRLSAFMRFTRRKYETAYESIAAAAQHSPLGASNPPHLQQPTGPLGPGSVSAFHHHSPSSSSTSSSSATTHRSPSSTMAPSTISPHQHPSHASGPFDHHGQFNGTQKVSPTGAAEALADGHLPRNSPASMLAPPPPNTAAYPQHHPMFAQNPAAFLHPGLPFYPSAYHAAAAAAAAQLQSSPTAATGPWSMGAGYPGFPTPGDHFGGFGPSVPISAANAGTGAPKIWRSVDTEQLEAALSTTSEDGVECQKKSSDSDHSHKNKKLKKDEDHADSIDVVGGSEQRNDQRTSRCSSNVSSSHGDEEGRADDDSNDRHTPAVTAVSDDSNGSMHLKQKDTEEDQIDHDEVNSNHSSRAHHSEADEDNRASEPEEEDDVDVVSSDSEANHPPVKANRSQRRPTSPFDANYPTKHRFSHAQLYHHHGHRHHSADSFHHFSHSLVSRSDSVGSATEAAPVS